MTPRPERVPIGSRSVPVPALPFDLESAIPPREACRPLDDREIDLALDRPIGGPTLDAAVRGARNVLVVVSDGSRSTGTDRYLPRLVERVTAAGVGEIAFAVASGLHRTPSGEDVRRILGPGLAKRHRVILHDADDDDGLVELGSTRAGTPVRVNAAVGEFDRLVLTGAAGFHYYAGFSGGRKAVVPGLAARETIVGNHLRAIRPDGRRDPRARAGRLDGNPVHRDMVEAAAMTRPAFLINAVLGPGGDVERLFCGHWRRAHEAAGRYLRKTRRILLPPRDLVVVSAGGHPADIDLVQAHKAFEATYRALRPGGVMVLVAACPEGAGQPDFLSGFDPPSSGELATLLLTEYRVYRQTALSWRRKAEGCKLVLVSDLDAETARKVGAEPACDLTEAFDIARSVLPAGAAGWVFPEGVRWLVESSEDAT
jgi:nickel-dependent lactate racemase